MTDNPTIRRKFVMMDPLDNHNKFWLVEFWQSRLEFKTTWGRVGITEQSKTKNGDQWDVEKLIDQKIDKGYTEVELHIPTDVSATSPTAGPIVSDPKVDQLLQLIFKEAGDNIKSYLAVGVDALSKTQIAKGRDYIAQLADPRGIKDLRYASGLIRNFFNTIPTQLPHKIDSYEWENICREFMSDLNKQETRLDQLEAALATFTAQSTGNTSQLASLGGVSIAPMDQMKNSYKQIVDYILRTAGGRVKVAEVYSVTIPTERQAWDNDTVGKDNVMSLFHGTRTHNVRHILRTGLIIPQVAANGSRLGRGIYFADKSQKSMNYAGGNYDPRKILFVTDVALGKSIKIDGTCSYSAAPAGYQSVWGTKSWSGHDEFVVYRLAQQTIRAVVILA